MTSDVCELMPATANDAEALYAILRENAVWMKAQGIEQWTKLLPIEQVEEEIRLGYVLKLVQQGALVGTLTLTPERDPYWPNDTVPALYLHRLAVRKEFKGQRLGETALKLAEIATKARGYATLRLDCINRNQVLVAYYTRAGFTDVGIGSMKQGVGSSGAKNFRLFEKHL